MPDILRTLLRPARFFHLSLAVILVAALTAGCAEPPVVEEALVCPSPIATVEPAAPPMPSCDNEKLTSYDALLVVTPHPDDEVLAFAGLITEYLAQGKPVEVVVSTDGDAYCNACQFWKNSSVTGATCSAEDLSNFATPEIDSFAEVRHAESRAALEILGAGLPTFLGYPDTGLAAAWANFENDELDKRVTRSDFSACAGCETCGEGYGGGPETDLSASALIETITARLSATPEGTLVATTHWLDGHGDHAALGNFVKTINQDLSSPRAIAFGVIHAHTAKDTPHSDCWYPGPQALACPCAEEDCASQDPGWIARLRDHRYRPEWPAALPDDADYGPETQLCIAEDLFRGENAKKLAAVESYASQLGFAARDGAMPAALGGLMDCNGYLISFVRSTEAFFLFEPDKTAT